MGIHYIQLFQLMPFPQTLQEIFDYTGFELVMEDFILDQPLYEYDIFISVIPNHALPKDSLNAHLAEEHLSPLQQSLPL
jgi:hypothetical protein